MEKLNGDKDKFKPWFFEFVVCLGRADSDLKDKLDKLIKGVPREETDLWNMWRGVSLRKERR